MAVDIADVLPRLALRRSISDMLHRTAARLPGKHAIIARNTGLTFAEPEAAVRRTAAGIFMAETR